MISYGVPVYIVSKILGRSKVSVTLSIYAQSNTVVQEQAAKIMDALTTPFAIDLGKTKRISAEINPNLQELHQENQTGKATPPELSPCIYSRVHIQV